MNYPAGATATTIIRGYVALDVGNHMCLRLCVPNEAATAMTGEPIDVTRAIDPTLDGKHAHWNIQSNLLPWWLVCLIRSGCHFDSAVRSSELNSKHNM
jgi:hypothetical protein